MMALRRCARALATSRARDDPFSAAFWRSAADWRRAARNTTRCLVGCSAGDLGCLYALAALCPEVGAPAAMAASMCCGVATSLALETVALRVGEGFATWRAAAATAAKMSMLSMLSMEAAENAAQWHLTGGDLGSDVFFAALPYSVAAGFFTPLPYNYYALRRYGRACH